MSSVAHDCCCAACCKRPARTDACCYAQSGSLTWGASLGRALGDAWHRRCQLATVYRPPGISSINESVSLCVISIPPRLSPSLNFSLQAPECTSSCEKPKCAWRCRKPDICPRPKCKLLCEQKAGCPEPSHEDAAHSAGPAPQAPAPAAPAPAAPAPAAGF